MQLFAFHSDEEVGIAGGDVGWLVEYDQLAAQLGNSVALAIRNQFEVCDGGVAFNFCGFGHD